jgi:hypothetical protein
VDPLVPAGTARLVSGKSRLNARISIWKKQTIENKRSQYLPHNFLIGTDSKSNQSWHVLDRAMKCVITVVDKSMRAKNKSMRAPNKPMKATKCRAGSQIRV